MFKAGSGYEAWWNCKDCNTPYLRRVFDRVKLKRSCKKCFTRIYSEKKNNITVSHPKIALEWDYKKNKNVNIKNITPGASRFKYWWKCLKCGKSYQRTAQTRVKYNNLLSCKFH